MVGVIEESPTANTAVTLLGIVWTGIFGSFAALLLREPGGHGVAFIAGGVLCVIAYDTFAYVGGVSLDITRWLRALAPEKPGKARLAPPSLQCLTGGLIVQVISPWGVASGLAIGLVVAVVAPIGDLAESMVKRDLGSQRHGPHSSGPWRTVRSLRRNAFGAACHLLHRAHARHCLTVKTVSLVGSTGSIGTQGC